MAAAAPVLSRRRRDMDSGHGSERLLVSLAAWHTLLLQVVVSGAGQGGSWQLLVANAGISAMHAAVSHRNTVILLDRTNIGPSQIALPDGACRDNPRDRRSKHDCTAHSVLLVLGSNHIRPLTIFTDTWCSSGQFAADGSMIQTGGDADGGSKIRYLAPACAAAPAGRCDWVESSAVQLQEPRWYATNHILPGNQQIVVGGRGVFTWELVPPRGQAAVELPFLRETRGQAQADNLYPFVQLLPRGTLFIFANTASIEYDYRAQAVVRRYPVLPGGPRNYPSAGSSVMLALRPDAAAGGYTRAEVLVCGGAQAGAYSRGASTAPATQTCGRIEATATAPEWEVESMPSRRVMGDMVLLPNAEVCIINGAHAGAQGWGLATNPALAPVIYSPDSLPGARFRTQAASTVARLYHSTANLLPDARVLVAGGNTHETYTFSGPFPTELRVEAFSPDYLQGGRRRPSIVDYPGERGVTYGAPFSLTLDLHPDDDAHLSLQLSLMSAPFATHSFSQGQRLVSLPWFDLKYQGQASVLTAIAPPSPDIAPSGYYMLFAVSQGIPSRAVWLHLL